MSSGLPRVVVGFVALQHLGFFVLESFLWTTEFGRGVFKASTEFAETTRALALNQGVYNAFLAAALIVALVVKDAAVARAFACFGLACVVVAGVVGGLSVDPGIVVVQAVPAGVGLAMIWRSSRTPDDRAGRRAS